MPSILESRFLVAQLKLEQGDWRQALALYSEIEAIDLNSDGIMLFDQWVLAHSLFAEVVRHVAEAAEQADPSGRHVELDPDLYLKARSHLTRALNVLHDPDLCEKGHLAPSKRRLLIAKINWELALLAVAYDSRFDTEQAYRTAINTLSATQADGGSEESSLRVLIEKDFADYLQRKLNPEFLALDWNVFVNADNVLQHHY